jgi:hypothetical protein
MMTDGEEGVCQPDNITCALNTGVPGVPACTYKCKDDYKICPDGLSKVGRDFTKKDCPFNECPVINTCVCGEPCKMADGEPGVC